MIWHVCQLFELQYMNCCLGIQFSGGVSAHVGDVSVAEPT